MDIKQLLNIYTNKMAAIKHTHKLADEIQSNPDKFIGIGFLDGHGIQVPCNGGLASKILKALDERTVELCHETAVLASRIQALDTVCESMGDIEPQI